MKQSAFRPRGPLNEAVAGICGVARLTDKARAARSGEIRNYKYGDASKQDTETLVFLGMSATVFQEAAFQIDDDARLGAWILENCGKSDKDIATFNRKLRSEWRRKMPQDDFASRRRELDQKDEDRWLFWTFPGLWIWRALFKR